jgi:hypothetical protein
MLKSRRTPIARTLFALLRTDKDGALTLRDQDANALTDALLAHSDGDLRAAVWELVHVAKVASEQLMNDRIADQILEMASLAIDQLKRIACMEEAEIEGMMRAIAERNSPGPISAIAPTHGATRVDDRISASSMLARRLIR